MNYKNGISLFFCLALTSASAYAEKQNVSVMETSTSGKLVRINIGLSSGLNNGEPVLFSNENGRVAAGRIIRTDQGSAVVAVLEQYATPVSLGDYSLLFGEPFPEADNLPNYVTDREAETPNPSNERFFTPDGREIRGGPELDDEDYTPETTLRPKFPDSKTYSTHNISVGVGLFRNRSLATTTNPLGATKYTFYQGYSLRYAYNFKTHYWLKERAPALISVETTMGIYSFDHSFPATDTSAARTAQVRVIPLGFNLRYLFEVSRLFRLYPYLGYQSNIVGASNANVTGTSLLKGGRLLGGGGGQLVMSDTMDSRIEGGSDGVFMGVVVKF